MEYPKRKPTRLKDFDYGTQGSYFITTCTQDLATILSEVTSGETPTITLTECGKIAEKYIKLVPEKYTNVSVDKYVIMPNHMHILFTLANEKDEDKIRATISTVMGWMKYQITKEIHLIDNNIGQKIFQRSFYDHIVRNRADYDELVTCIIEAPLKWAHNQTYLPK